MSIPLAANHSGNDDADMPTMRAHQVLLIEDNKGDALLVQKSLRDAVAGEQIEFTIVPRMSKALQKLSERDYELIILDLGLPDTEGSASVTALRSCARNTPIIVNTGASNPSLREQALTCGAQYYWNKGRERSIFFKAMVEQSLRVSKPQKG